MHQSAASLRHSDQTHDRNQDNTNAHDIDTDRECGDESDAVLHHASLLVLGLEDADQEHGRGDLDTTQEKHRVVN